MLEKYQLWCFFCCNSGVIWVLEIIIPTLTMVSFAHIFFQNIGSKFLNGYKTKNFSFSVFYSRLLDAFLLLSFLKKSCKLKFFCWTFKLLLPFRKSLNIDFFRKSKRLKIMKLQNQISHSIACIVQFVGQFPFVNNNMSLDVSLYVSL